MQSTEAARAAVHAAKNESRWGLYAALRYAIKRGATFAMFDQVRQFEERRRLRASFRGYLA